MANSKLLKEAIADAKAVKETALANAKLALEEAFTPRLQSILSQKMRAEAEEMGDEEQEATNEELDSTGIGSKVGTDAAETPGSQPTLTAMTDLSVGVTKDGGKPEQSGTDYEKVADINEEDDYDFGGEEEEEDPNAGEIAELRARLAELTGEEGEEEGNPFAATEEEDPSTPFGDDSSENPFGMEAEADDDMYGDEEEGENSLEAIIRELEASINGEEGSAEEAPAEEDPNAAQIAELRRQLAELEDGEEVPAEEEPKTESKRLRESRRKLREDYTDGAEAGTDPDGEKVIDLEEILREMEDDLKKGEPVEEGDEPNAEELEKDLNEAYKTIKSLQSTINEVNLLNAKLLFANKLFRAHNMTNEQKVKVIETLDRTKSVREVKLVYSTLAENFKYTSSNRIAKKSIAEGIASKVVKSTKPSVQKQVISESVAVANRFKKLAGIIK
jgi:hypothetical protein